jgi:hypothetical protein
MSAGNVTHSSGFLQLILQTCQNVKKKNYEITSTHLFFHHFFAKDKCFLLWQWHFV